MTQQVTDIFLEWIREGLKQSGKSQLGLARHLNVAHPQITRLLHGNRSLKVDEIPKIAIYLELDPPSFGAKGTNSVNPETQLRSALITYGIDKDDLDQVVGIIDTFVSVDEPEETPSLDDAQPSNLRRESARSK